MEFENFYSRVGNLIDSWHVDNSLNAILVNFTGASPKWTLTNDDSAEAPALIRPQQRYIAFNPVLISAMLFDLRKELKLVDDNDEFIRDWFSATMLVVRNIKLFLLLHEIGHWLYTADPSQVVSLARQHCNELPLELAMFLYNVVEDSVIQRLFMLEYRSSVYRRAFDLGICCFQGAEAVKTYVSNCEESEWSIKSKLFYFIIRAYNLHNSEVQNMFNIPDKLGWSEDTIKAFDEAIITIDKLERAEYVFKVLAPLVLKDLLEEIDSSEETESSEGSLLDQDKLYKEKESSQPQNSGESESSKQSSNSSEGVDGKSTEEDKEDNGTKGEGTSDSSKNEEGSKENQGTGDGSSESSGSKPSQDSSDSKESEESTNSSEDSSSNQQSSQDNSQQEPINVTPKDPGKTTIEKVAEACKELNKQILGSNEPKESSSIPKLKPQNNPLATSCNVKDHTSSYSKDSSTSYMNSITLSVYNNALNVLDKIFTMSNSVMHGLDTGELDEDELYTYYSEKNLNIYKEEHIVKQDKKVLVYFVLDNSGSMSGARFDYSSAAFVGLIHALEDIQIKCCLLTFGRKVRLLKRFDESINFLGRDSNLQHRVDVYASNLESDTNLFPALDYIINDEPFLDSDPNLCKVVIVATDGSTNNMSECAYLAEKIAEDALVFSIGLDMSGREDYLQAVMPGAIVRNYSGSTIATKLPEDIYEEIINRFLLY